eukprot:PLAT12306.1.p1 GENE.PLAT12306.1~~PLAT12306.1.p1  ORF type:complete len:403 (-),score=194.61 PLAT12306.1:108-1316(-)
MDDVIALAAQLTPVQQAAVVGSLLLGIMLPLLCCRRSKTVKTAEPSAESKPQKAQEVPAWKRGSGAKKTKSSGSKKKRGAKKLHELQDSFAKGHSSRLTAVAFSPDGQLLATASRDRTVRVHVLVGEKSSVKLEIEGDHAVALAFAGSNSALALTLADAKVVRIYRVSKRGFELRSEWATEHRRPLSRLLSRGRGEEAMVVTAGDEEDCVIFVRNRHGDRLARIDTAQMRLYDIAVSPDGSALAAATHASSLRVWERLPERKPGSALFEKAHLLPGLPARAAVLDFGTEDLLFIGCTNGDWLLAQFDRGERVMLREKPRIVASGSSGFPTLSHVACAPDGSRAALLHENAMKVIALPSGELLHELGAVHDEDGVVVAAAYAPDGSRLATGGSKERWGRLWRL